MRGAKKIFSFKGFPIHVHFTFLILLALFVLPGWGDDVKRHAVQLAWVPILSLAILVHELGHALAIRRFGYGHSSIMLWGMGGVCVNSARYSPRHGMWIALAGPIAGALLGIPFIPLLFFDLGSMVHSLTWNILMVTIGFSVANMLPIFPLDGGRVLAYALRHYSKRRDRHEWAIRTTGLVGLILMAPLVLLSLLSLEIWLLFVLFFLGQQTWQAWRYGTQAIKI